MTATITTTTIPSEAMPSPQQAPRRQSGRVGDLVFAGVARLAAVVTLALLVAIIASLVAGAWPSIKHFGLAFLWTAEWDPVQQKFGGLIMIYGTLMTSLIALLIAVPVSFGIALFLTELSPRWLKRPLGTAIELLAAVPSIVYGMWGLLVFSPILAEFVQQPLQSALGSAPFVGQLFSGPPVGIGILSAGIILAIMITPIISAVVRDVLAAVPDSQREAALALGATKWETTRVVLVNAAPGIAGAIILGLGRALGETMAVTMVIGNRPAISLALFEPSYTIASVIANEFTEATKDLYLSALVELGLILFLVTFVVNAIARLLVWNVTRKSGTVGAAV